MTENHRTVVIIIVVVVVRSMFYPLNISSFCLPLAYIKSRRAHIFLCVRIPRVCVCTCTNIAEKGYVVYIMDIHVDLHAKGYQRSVHSRSHIILCGIYIVGDGGIHTFCAHVCKRPSPRYSVVRLRWP